MSERGDEDVVGMDRGENKGEPDVVVELDFTCCEVDGETEAKLIGMATCGSSVWDGWRRCLAWMTVDGIEGEETDGIELNMAVPLRRSVTCTASDISCCMVVARGDVVTDAGQAGSRLSDLEKYRAGGKDRANIVLTSGGDVGNVSGDDVFELLAGGARSGDLSLTTALAVSCLILACHIATFASHCLPNTAISVFSRSDYLLTEIPMQAHYLV